MSEAELMLSFMSKNNTFSLPVIGVVSESAVLAFRLSQVGRLGMDL